MSAADLNAAWAGGFADAAYRAGLRWVVVAPGSRSTPLVLAFSRHGGFRLVRQPDERSAAFFALGIGKATGTPAAVVTTSGTATANLYPAVIEADMSASPLLVLTADRPHRLRGTDANQTIDQAELYGRHVRRFVDVPEPRDDAGARRGLAALAGEAIGIATGELPGPVHLNFPFDKPLEPDSIEWGPERGGAPGHAAGPEIGVPGPRADDALVAHVARLLDLTGGSEPGGLLVVAGPGPGWDAGGGPGSESADLGSLVGALGGVLLADPLSGARYGSGAQPALVTHYDAALRNPAVRRSLRPGAIVRLGGAPTSATLLGALEEWADVPQLLFRRDGRLGDHLGTVTEHYAVDGVDLLSRLPARAPGEYARRWESVEKALREAAAEIPDDFLEGWTARAVIDEAPAGSVVFLSSSMPIRDVDAFGGPGSAPVIALGNRGASGIDGIVSTALGAGVAADRPMVCLLGDLALLHDGNGFLTSGELARPAVFVVVDNDGGGIFHRLPVSRFEPDFTEYFATPHGLDLEHLARLHRLPFRRVSAPGEIRSALREGLSRPGASLVCVTVDRPSGHRARLAAEEQLGGAAVIALGAD